MNHVKALLIGGFCLIELMLAAQSALLRDTFDDQVVDEALWNVVRPYATAPRSTVTESNSTLVLFRRGIVEATGAFPASLDMEGKFRFTGDNDALSIVFRSDLTVTNQFERRGVQVALQESSAKIFIIRDPFSTSAPPVQGAFTIMKNQDVRFRIVDHEDVIRVYLDSFFQPLMTLAVTNRRGDRIALYNGNGNSARMALDDFAVYPAATTLFLDTRLVREGPLHRTNAAVVRIQSFFTNATIFYTLDGSEPSFSSSEYTAPFALESSATLRAIAYSSDFGNTSLSSSIEVQIIPDVVLTNLTPGGGVIQFEPPGPVYPSNTIVSVTALPAPGWQFLRWEGAAEGENVQTLVVMTNHVGVRAVFGAAPAFTIVGNGQPVVTPESPVLQYGASVRYTAYPAAGNYFLRWGNAVTGTNNPVSFVFTNANAAVTVIFAALAADRVSLVTPIKGNGRVASAPGGNTFSLGQTVSLLAVPDTNYIFVGWSGDAISYTNPVSVLMDASKVVTARFGQPVRFEPAFSVWDGSGFTLSFTGPVGMTFELQASSNFMDWTSIAPLLNETGRVTHVHGEAVNVPSLFYRVLGP